MSILFNPTSRGKGAFATISPELASAATTNPPIIGGGATSPTNTE